MRFETQSAELLLAEDGRRVLELAGLTLPDKTLVPVVIKESEDLGLWIELRREDGIHLFLLRWEYVIGIDLPGRMEKPMGLKG